MNRPRHEKIRSTIDLLCKAQTQMMDRLESDIETIVEHGSDERAARPNLEGTLRHQLNFSDKDIAAVREKLTFARLHSGDLLAPSLAADLINKDLTFQWYDQYCQANPLDNLVDASELVKERHRK